MILLSGLISSEKNNETSTEPWRTSYMSLVSSDSVEPILMA